MDDPQGGGLRVLDQADQRDDALRRNDPHRDGGKHRAQHHLSHVPQPQGRRHVDRRHREDPGRRPNLDGSHNAGTFNIQTRRVQRKRTLAPLYVAPPKMLCFHRR